MIAEELITRSPATLPPAALVMEAARLMEDRGVGSVVIVEGDEVVGIVTDRDIVVGLLAFAEDGYVGLASVGEVMTPSPVCVLAGDDIEHCLVKMEAHSIRRLPVKNEHGELIGVVSLDDIMMQLASELGKAGALIGNEVMGKFGGMSRARVRWLGSTNARK
jgi:CBS domain-containing protein